MVDMSLSPTSKLKFHHLGLVVKSIAEGKVLLAEMLGNIEWSKIFDDKEQLVSVCFGRVENHEFFYELIEPLEVGSPIDKVLQNSTNIINHVAYTTTEFDTAFSHLRSLGCVPIGPAKKAVAFEGQRIIFFLTKLNFIIEVIEVSD